MIADTASSVTCTHTRGERPIEFYTLLLSSDPGVIFTVEEIDFVQYVVERDASTFVERARDAHPLPAGPHVFCGEDFVLSEDGRLAVGLDYRGTPGVCVFDRPRGALRTIEIPEGYRLPRMSWVTTGASVAVTDPALGTHLIDLEAGVVKARLAGSFVAAGEGVIVVQMGLELVMFSLDRQRELGRWAIERNVPWGWRGAVTRGGTGLWCAARGDGAMTQADVWQCELGRPASRAGRVAFRAPIATVVPCGEGLALVSSRCEVAVVQPETDGRGMRIEPREGRRGLRALGRFRVSCASSDGRRVVGRVGHVPVLVELSSGDVTTFDVGPSGDVCTIVGSPSARWVGVGWSLGDLAILAADTLDEVWRFETEDGFVAGCAFSPDERTFYALTASHLRSWDIATGVERGPVTLSRRGISNHTALLLSADGRLALLHTGQDHPMGSRGWTLLDLATGCVVAEIVDATATVGSACFSERGDEVIVIEAPNLTFGRDLSIVRRDARSGEVIDRRRVGDGVSAQAAQFLEERLDFPVLLDRGRVLLGAPWSASGRFSYVRCDLASREASAHEVERCAFVAEGARLGVFVESARADSEFGARVVLRDLTTLREVAHVRLAHEESSGRAALLDDDRTLFVGLRGGRLARFSVGNRSG